jgi:hypothetical protein
MNDKEVIEELISLKEHCANMMESKHHEPWKSDVQALNFAIKAIRIVEVIENGFKRDGNMIDFDDWEDIKEFVEKEADNEIN